MKTSIARAMQISCLEKDQIERLHSTEKRLGYILQNWNIQRIFGIGTIKDKYNLPSDNELLSAHNDRVEAELKSKFVLEDLDFRASVEWFHGFDWHIQNRLGEIIFDYSGPVLSRRRGSAVNRIQDEA